ncbi:CHAT domain-containing protein [Arthrobacter sp. Leaf337]|uniref:CHAT domain-containing protein n=1 Tax=Arthrobacter sp. Leaf337 TaxID=1736342 RepID=UPI0009EBD82F|nr:CHAT domain-containing protein [Arthrobacter sp. Leaf337]
MTDYILTLRAHDDAAGDDPPITLRELGRADPIATHDSGFDTTKPFLEDGVPIDLASCLTAAGLLNKPRNEFVGTSLWERITPGEIGCKLKPHPTNSRLYLDLRSHALAAYPWELLRHSVWVLSTDTRMCIGQPGRSAKEYSGDPPAMDHPLRVLVVMGNDPADKKIQAEEELVAIEAAAQTKNDEVLLRALIRPTPADIEEALLKFRPHVLHFIGHGVRPAANVEPEIYVYGTLTRQNEAWGADRIRGVFRQMPPRLVVLNACLTGDAPTASTSLVEAFLDAGCIAVIAMMGEIRGDSSLAFSKRFYAELFAGTTVDAAVATARHEVRNLAIGQGAQPNAPALRSNWPLPRLTVRGNIETAITMTKSNSHAVRRWLIDDFVVRWDERWRVWQLLDSTDTRLALVSGQEQAGKTELLNTLAEICARHGESVIRVDLSGKTTGNSWHDVLTKIATEIDAEGLPSNRLKEIALEEGMSGPVIKNFRDELARCVGQGNSLLLVLDGLSDWQDNIVRDTLLPELFVPYLMPALGGTVAPIGGDVRILLATSKDWSDAWQARARPFGWQPIEIGPFPADEWDRAITHFTTHWISQVPEGNHESFRTMMELLRTGKKNGYTLNLIRGIVPSFQ